MNRVQYLTCKLKLHNPSARKRAVLDHALATYTDAYAALLDRAHAKLDLIAREGIYVDRSGKERYTGKSIARMLNVPSLDLHSSAKDSLIQDVAGGLASYFELLKTDENTSFPTCRTQRADPDAIENALEHFALVGADEEDYDLSRDDLLRQTRGRVMPMYFARPDGATQNRNFSLLWNRDKRQLQAALWLLPAGHEMCRPLNAKEGNLIRVDTGEIFTSNSKTAILCPLEMGKSGWQESKFLEPALRHEAAIKSAFLTRRDDTGEYFLHVSFAFPLPEQYEPQAYLGVDRGVFFSMAYAVVDSEGRIVLMNHCDDGFRHDRIAAGKRVRERQRTGRRVTAKNYRGKHQNAILHAVINDIIDCATEHEAMIVLENMDIQIKGKFYKSAWKKMHKLLEYKCALAGIPIWQGGVWAAYSSQICIYCGELNRGRKRDGSPFVCPSCGAEYHSDEGAGVNIARRAMYRKKDWEKRGGYMAFHRSFSRV